MHNPILIIPKELVTRKTISMMIPSNSATQPMIGVVDFANNIASKTFPPAFNYLQLIRLKEPDRIRPSRMGCI